MKYDFLQTSIKSFFFVGLEVYKINLQVRENQLRVLPPSICDLKNLKQLDVGRNELLLLVGYILAYFMCLLIA